MKLTDRLKREVRNHALYSLYRMNAKTADCYAFRLYMSNKRKIDFEGGWDWSYRLIDKDADYLFMLKDNRFIKREK